MGGVLQLKVLSR